MKSANVCKKCGHFKTAHSNRGCSVRFCDCKVKEKVER